MSVHAAARPMAYRRRSDSVEHVEGDDVVLDVELEPRGPLGLASVSVVERFARLGERRIPLQRDGRFLRGRYVLRSVPRGRYALDEANALVEDPFGVEQGRVPLAEQGALLVLPRIVELDVLFSESGPRADNGRRLLLRRPSGFDVHSVREYEEGESLRKVHWKSTARRGQLMVKELQDEPRDEVGDPPRRGCAFGRGRQLRRTGAGRRLAAPHAAAPRPPCGAGRELAPAGGRARADRARRVAAGARDARRG